MGVLQQYSIATPFRIMAITEIKNGANGAMHDPPDRNVSSSSPLDGDGLPPCDASGEGENNCVEFCSDVLGDGACDNDDDDDWGDGDRGPDDWGPGVSPPEPPDPCRNRDAKEPSYSFRQKPS